MTIHKLEQDPNIFITPLFSGNNFVYLMTHILSSDSRTTIRTIDLRKDKLTVHGTEINESDLRILHDSLMTEHGRTFVNCNGACYFFLVGKGLSRPIENVVFDWSRFGVVVPDSIHSSLRKELKDKDNVIDELNRQLLSTVASLKEARNEVTELKERVLSEVKTRKEKELELRNVSEKLSLVDFEFESNKIELESSKKAVLELQDQLTSCQDECQCMKTELGLLKDKVIELENHLLTCNKRDEEKEIELENMKDELSSVKFELESSKNDVRELEHQLEFTKNQLECSKKEVQELENQKCPCKEGHYEMGNKIRELSNDVHLINSEVRSSNRKIEQVLISMLWNDLVLHVQQPRWLLQPSLSMPCLPSYDEVDENEDHTISSGISNSHVSITIEEIDEDA